TLPLAGTPTVAQSTSTPLADWDVQCGVKLHETHDQNAATTIHTYDPLCRKIRTDLPGGGWETIDYQFGGNGSYTEVSQPGSRWRRTTFDGLGRVTKVTRSGNIIEKDVTYDKRGNIASSRRPRYDGAPAYGYAYSYDGRDRETSAVMPGAIVDGRWHPGDTKLTSYKLMTTVTTDAMGHPEWTLRDVRGRRVMVGSTDGMLNPNDLTKYFYDRRGNLERIEQLAQHGSSIAMTRYGYDSLGRKTWSSESNAGGRTFSYDANSNLIGEVDSTSNVMTHYRYDALDRRIARIAP